MRKTLAAAICIAVLATGAGCTLGGDDGGKMVFHGLLRDEIRTLDPVNASDAVSLEVIPCIFETLYQYGYLSDTYTAFPLLAVDMPKLSPDRLTVTIPLKRGVRFHDDDAFKETHGLGRELRAQDFIYGFKRHALSELNSQGWWIFDGKIVGFNAFREKIQHSPASETATAFAEDIEGLKALDDYTLQIKLTRPYPQLLHLLSLPFTAPIAHEVAETYGNQNSNMTEHPIGTGPFVLKHWNRGYKVTLERNPTYHPDFYPSNGGLEFRKQGMFADAGKPLPFLDKIVWEVIKEDQPAWLRFLKGSSDLTTIPKDNFSQAITNQVNLTPELSAKGIRLNMETGVRLFYVSFNLRDHLLGKNKYLRQAMSAAIDRDRWISLFTNGTGKKAVNALPPGVADRPQDSQIKYDFNLIQAKELMKAAGFPEGKGLPAISFDMRGADALNHQLGDFFTQQFAAIGIKLNVIYNSFPVYLLKLKKSATQISYGGWGMDYPDAENIFQLLYGPNHSPGANDSNFNNPEMNKLYEKMSEMESGPARATLIRRMDSILQEECPWALGYYFADYRLSQPWLLNYRPSEIVANKYKYLRINRDIKKRYLSWN